MFATSGLALGALPLAVCGGDVMFPDDNTYENNKHGLHSFKDAEKTSQIGLKGHLTANDADHECASTSARR